MLGGFVNSLLRKVTGEDASLLKAARDDPQLLQVIADPGLVRAVEEILRDKTNLEKYKGTPELLDSVLSVVSKVDALSGRTPSLVPHAGQPGHVQLVHKEVVARTAPPPAYDLEDKADMPWYAKDWEIGKHLAQKGFCIVRGSLSSDVRHQAIAEASQLKSTGGFKRLPKEVLSGFFGEHGSAWTRHLCDPTASAHPEEEALHAVDTHLGHLGFDLASCSEAFFGLRLEGRTLGRVHCSRRAEDQPSPPLKDPNEADEYLALFMRKKLKLVYFLGPGLATLAISTIEDDSQAFRTLVQPGTLLVLRCDVCRCALESKVSELSVSVEVDFLAEQTCGTLESVLDRVQPPRELHAWYVGRLQAIAENDAKEVPSEWIKLAKQTFFHPRQCIRVSEVSHNLPTTVHDATSWRCPFGAAALGGNDCIAEIPSSKWDMDVYYDPDPANVDDFKMYTRHMGALDGVRTLMDDRDFADFGIIPAEAGPIDSRHILLHDSAVQCFGQAGIGKLDTRGKDIGFFCGISGNEMYYQLLSREVKLGKFSYASMSNATTVNRLSWLFGSTGPSLAIDTEDSSGSAALDTATSYLREDRCHQALASGVSLVQHPFSLIVSCASGFISKSGRGRAFDESSDGIVRSEGVVCLLLEVHERSAEDSGLNTEEGDTATARTLISGSALNSKGLSSSLTAPSGLAMKDVLERAFKDARCPASIVDGIEANAGGSTLTDAVELGVLRTSFASPKEDVSDTVVLRSFKSVLGDSGAPSGLAGIARACVALAQAVHGPSLHLKQLFELGEEENDSWGSSSPASVLAGVRRLILPSEVVEAAGFQQTVGVSSFGSTGTNVHHVLMGQKPKENLRQRPGKPLGCFPGAGPQRKASSQQVQYHIIGSWDAWEKTQKMEAESDGVYSFPVTLGENCWETFQIWEDDDPNKVLHPNCHWGDQDSDVCGPSRSAACGRFSTWRISGHPTKVRLINEEQAKQIKRSKTEVMFQCHGGVELRTVVAFPGDYRPEGHESAEDISGMPVMESSSETGRPGDRYRVCLHVFGKNRRLEWRKASTSLREADASAEQVEVPFQHSYYLSGDFNFWTFRQMEEVSGPGAEGSSASSGSESRKQPRIFRAKVQLLKDGGVFQVVRDKDWDQTFYPEAGVTNPPGSSIVGPDAFGLGRGWPLGGKAGDIFEVEFRRSVATSGSDDRSVTWNRLEATGTALDYVEVMARSFTYCVVGSWSHFTKREEMSFDEERQAWVADVVVGQTGLECFQVLLNGNWLAVVHPGTDQASFRDADHQLLGPELLSGTNLCWAIGKDEEDSALGPGDVVQILLEVGNDGLPRAIRWRCSSR
ncbi:unnamed protein product [Polarella glacialis]|uniref:Ketosynthase family 3 (KS3) domain-containing protein n=1 Tax=Polarella glacialis TaxID=89957 RepID=A0A813H3T8_POLGL|nr:unnamed protein product [Polarella glacialis]